jgi:hypothetical protein
LSILRDPFLARFDRQKHSRALRFTNGTGGAGEKAVGFPVALWSTTLNPTMAGDTIDFAAKFLNPGAAGGAVWHSRFKNYLGLPVFITTQIGTGVNARVFREFKVVDSTSPVAPYSCGTAHCNVQTDPGTIVTYTSGFAPVTQPNLHFRGRLFDGQGGEVTRASGDDVTQTYTFQLPARTPALGLPEYALMTYLVPTLPSGQGTDITMAPNDAVQPDSGATYQEFTYRGAALTGRITQPSFGAFCAVEEPTGSGFRCTTAMTHVLYRAITRIEYDFLSDLPISYQFSAALSLPAVTATSAVLATRTATLQSAEGALP